jgi:hypothetical protein
MYLEVVENQAGGNWDRGRTEIMLNFVFHFFSLSKNFQTRAKSGELQ